MDLSTLVDHLVLGFEGYKFKSRRIKNILATNGFSQTLENLNVIKIFQSTNINHALLKNARRGIKINNFQNMFPEKEFPEFLLKNTQTSDLKLLTSHT